MPQHSGWLGFVTYAPIITVALLQVLKTQSFCTESSTVLTKGIQPFNLMLPGFSSQASESAAAAADYDHITMGSQQINYSNIQAIQGCQNLVLPTSTSSVGVHIHTSYITLAMMPHALLNKWVRAKMELPNLIAPIPNGATSCVLWMMLCFHQFFQTAWMNPAQGTLPPPRMTKLVDHHQLLIFQHMALPIPIKYLLARWPGMTQCATWAPLEQANGGNKGHPGNRIQNPTPNAAFHPYNRARRLSAILARHPVPTNAHGRPVCLSYHMHNACNSKFPHAGNHWVHTPAKDNAILAWAR